MVVRPLRKPGGGRRRQLVFADPEVQISDKAMKEQIENPLAETVNLVEEQTETTPLNKLTGFKYNIYVIPVMYAQTHINTHLFSWKGSRLTGSDD